MVGAESIVDTNGQVVKSKDSSANQAFPVANQVALFEPVFQVLATCSEVADPVIPDGSWGNPSDNAAGAYFTIVNGSPYDFVLESSPSYQMLDWVWDRIPAG
jgi:hypothetical protein